jgi:hypothetical protein
MPPLSRPIAFALLTLSLPLIQGCQTHRSQITTTGTEHLITENVPKLAYAPILISRDDVLTRGTQAQIENHNNIYWCQHPDKRPPSFDAAIC